MILKRCFNASVLIMLAFTIPSYGQTVAPTLKTAIEPQYSAAEKKVTDIVSVELTIDEKGIPVEVRSSRGLDNKVVVALTQFRFNPASDHAVPVASAIRLNISVPQELDYFWSVLDRPTPDDSKAFQKSMSGESKLNLFTARTLEMDLDKTDKGIPARASLVAFAATQDGNEFRQMQGRQIEWFVRNKPDSMMLGLPIAMLFTADIPFQNSASYQSVRAAWLEQLAEHPADPFITAHAAYFFRLSDPAEAERVLLSSITKVGGVPGWLGELYALSALGVTSIDYRNGRARTAGSKLPDSDFGKHAQTELATTSDGRIVLAGFATIKNAGRSLAKHQSLPEGFAEFCQSLAARAKFIDTAVTGDCSTTEPPAVSTDSKVTGGRLVKHPNPVYPAEAKKQNIQGEMKFQALVGEDGKVKSLKFLNGPLIFYPTTRDTLLKWEYSPTLLNGESVEVYTTITVNFDLPKR